MLIRSRFFLICTLLITAFHLQAHEVPKDIKDVILNKVAEDVYVMHGVYGMPDKTNKGLMSNAGVVISDEGVVIVDTGGSLLYGEMLVKQIRDITSKPVVAVFNTHLHGDHWLGNAAIRKAYPDAKIYAHENAITRLKAGDADIWLNIFGSSLGRILVGDTPVIPELVLKGGESIELAGNSYKAHYTGPAHTDGDIMIEHPGSKLLFGGDVLVMNFVPSNGRPEDFSAKGQIKGAAYALELPVDIYVPGHGPTGGREVPESTKRFLEILYESVETYYDEGLQDFEMRDQVIADLAEFKDWHGMDNLGRMISFVYQQVEAAEFE